MTDYAWGAHLIETGEAFLAPCMASPSFDKRDQDMAQALSDHAALAITNARLLQSSVSQPSTISGQNAERMLTHAR